MILDENMHPSLPKYARLMEAIKGDIQRHALLPNQQLPNEDDLAAQYGISRGTVRKALAELQRQGLLRIEQGRGTFVSVPKPALNTFSLVEFDHYLRLQNRALSTQTLTFETIATPPDLADKLELPTHAPIFHIVQLHRADGLPLIYEERFFDVGLCPTLSHEEIEQFSIHWLLVEKYQIPLLRLSYDIEIVPLPADKFGLFDVSEAVQVFVVNRLSFTQHNGQLRPAIWYQALYRTDEYHFQAQFHTAI